MRIRKAKPRDKKLFLRLFDKYLESIKDLPGATLRTDKNMKFMGDLFDLYVGEVIDGIVLLVAQDAFVMQGETGSQPLDTEYGRIAVSWGLYVNEGMRGKGVGYTLQERAEEALKEMGFDTITGTIDETHEAGYNICMKQGYQIAPPVVFLDLHRKEK